MPLDSILQSWYDNAEAWATTIAAGGIASRKVATNAAIVAAVLSQQPTRVLDLGSGEGWLSRTLSKKGIAVLGADGVPALVNKARQLGGDEQYQCLSYIDFIKKKPNLGWFDVIAINFALFEEAPTLALLDALQHYSLPKTGRLILQSVALPNVADSGWRTEDWQAMPGVAYSSPMSWFYRNEQRWKEDMQQLQNWRIDRFQPIHHPETDALLSWVIVLQQV